LEEIGVCVVIASLEIVFGYIVVFEIDILARYYYIDIISIHAVEFYFYPFSSHPVINVSIDFSTSSDTSLIIIFFIVLILLKDNLSRYDCKMQVQNFKGTIINLAFENTSKLMFDSVVYYIFFSISLD